MPIGNPEAPNSKPQRRKSVGNWFNDLKKDVQDDLNIPPILPQKKEHQQLVEKLLKMTILNQ